LEEHIATIFRIEEQAEQETSRALFATSFHASFMLGLFFDPEDGGDVFLRNVG
jgi:hypothetical protein